MEIVTPARASVLLQRWTSEESDPSGRYTAEYKVLTSWGASDVQQIRKRKMQYERAAERQSNGSRQFLEPRLDPKGEFTACFDKRTWSVTCVNGSETLYVSVNTRRVSVSKTQLTVTHLRDELPSGPEITGLELTARKLVQARDWVPMFARSREAEDRSVARSQVGNLTADSLLAAVAGLNLIEPSDTAVTRVFLKLRAHFLLTPTIEERFRALLLADPAAASVRTLAQSLSSAGTPSAQAVLVEALRLRATDRLARNLFLFSLGAVEKPTPTTVRTLMEFAAKASAENDESTALLTLGIATHNVRGENAALADSVVDWLRERLRTASDGAGRADLIEALGNASASAATGELLGALKDVSPQIRGAAVRALRNIQSEQVDLALSQALTKDPSEYVRRRAASSIETRLQTKFLIGKQLEALGAEPASSIRIALLRSIWQARSLDPSIARVIRERAERDPSPEVRTIAKQLVEVMSRTKP
jgi:hypothetical protein